MSNISAPKPPSLSPGPEKSSGGRVVSIDALRGFDMFWITGGTAILHAAIDWADTPKLAWLNRQISHSDWNGFTFYDLIFPLFLFIVGTSLPFALSRRVERGEDRTALRLHVAKRAALLLVLGWIYNDLLAFDFSEFRFAGVLQRIALCYFFAANTVLCVGIRGQAATLAGILLGYWALMTLVPVPGVGAGVLTPEGNLAGYLDRLLLPGDMCCYGHGDNEGLLSTLPAIATVLLGVLAGHWLRSGVDETRKSVGLAIAGVGCLLLALIWNTLFPINKLIWSSSYVLCAGGWSLLLLALFHYLIDVRGYRGWAFFFVVIGMNAITIYLANRLFNFEEVSSIFIHGITPHLGAARPLFETVCEVAAKWLFLLFLYRQRIFLKA